METQPTLPTRGHAALLDQALQTFRSDERVVAILLGGSLVGGEVDEESDIDLTVVVADEEADEFSATWRDWLGRIADPVVMSPGPRPDLLTSLTPDGLRLDVTVERRSSMATQRGQAVLALYDPLGVAAGIAVVVPRFEPTPEWLQQNVEDFLRFLDQLNVVVIRNEWIAGIDNAWYLISQLVDLLAHRNRAARTSARRLNVRLTKAQREAIESLPAIRGDERAIVEVHVAIAQLYLPAAKEFYQELGLEWPHRLEQAVIEHLRRRTGAHLSP